MALPWPTPAALWWPPARGGRAGHPREERERKGEREKRVKRERGGCRPLLSSRTGGQGAPWPRTAAGGAPPASRSGVAPATPKRKEGKRGEFRFGGGEDGGGGG